jgi:hypothetical protein
MTPEELSERLLEFAARSGKVVDALPNTRLGRHVAGQLCNIIGQSVATAKGKDKDGSA